MASPKAGRIRYGGVVAALAFAAIAIYVCGSLGWWQWQRAQDQGVVIVPGPAVPIAEVTIPGESAGGIGQAVVVEGAWAEVPAAYLIDRDVEGQAATLLVLPLEVAADATGTGEPATLAILAGWLPAGTEPDAVTVAGPATVVGLLRGSEAAATVTPSANGEVLIIDSLSTASLAQLWPAPVYSSVVTADEPAPGWRALPAEEPERRLDFRSVTYAVEWWIFGAFAVFLALRWIRDNGRVREDAAAKGEQP